MGSKIALSLALAIPAAVFAQGDDPVAVFTEHPRLMLRPQRLRLLKRERERNSMRWQQFATLVTGSAPMPEPGFAWGLYYQVSGDEAYGKRAVGWALGPEGTKDLRQMALVFDWCQDAMSESQAKELTARLQKALAEAPGNETASRERDRVLAAIALFDHVPQTPQRELERVVRQWWNQRTIGALKAGRHVISREDAYPVWELMHTLRDSTNIDLRESYPKFFKEFPIEHLLSHYPAIWEAPENEYRIGASVRGTPDAHAATLSRAAELAMVAMDVNAAESQVLQGWLMHDKFILKGTFGAPYEFLWANPYQPGLSYYHVPLIFHAEEFGRLFVRSSWDPDADWFGYFDGAMQIFTDGKLTPLNPELKAPPVSLQEAWLCFAQQQKKWELEVDEEEAVFVLGLEPKRVYRVEIDDEEMYESAADAGGILVLDLPKGKKTGFRISAAGV